MISTEKKPNQSLRNPGFSAIFSFVTDDAGEDETWRRRLVSVSATRARAPSGKTNVPPLLPDFARIKPGKRRVEFCRAANWLHCLQAARFSFLLHISVVFYWAWQKRKPKSEL